MKLKIKGQPGYFEVPVGKADKRFFPFQFRGDEVGDLHGMVSEIVVENGTKLITLKSIIDIKNHYIQPVNIFRRQGEGSKWYPIGRIAPDQTFNAPLDAVYSQPYQFYFQIHGQGNKLLFGIFKIFDLSLKNPTGPVRQALNCNVVLPKL